MKSRTRKVIGVLGGIALVLSLSACSLSGGTPSATQQDQNTSTTILGKYQKSQPVPQFDYSQIRQTLIDIETAQAQSTQTTSFFFNQGVQDPYYVCPSIGFPVASTTQLTNPQQYIDNTQNGGTIAQIDPNGVFSGNSTGTYVICIDNNGQKYGQYAEAFVHSVSGAAHWDEAKHRIVITGAPTFKFSASK